MIQTLNQHIKKYQLENGLTVILETNHTAPVVSLNVGVKVGSAWETDQEAGLSHLLEHMVFKGTTSYGPGEIATIVEASGGELNAFTSLDQTVYYINLASRYAKKGLNLLKEMVFDALIDPVELAREKEVVLEEIRRGKDSPNKVASETLFSLAYQKHPYGRPVIGYEENVKAFTPEKVLEYYKRWYVPNNMIVVISGDFNEKEMREAIDYEFGKILSHPIARPEITTEPPILNSRTKQIAKHIEGLYLHLAFPVPHFTHEDIPALDLLSHLLGEGGTSRLEQIVKEKKGLVNSIHSYAFTPYFPGLFVIQAALPQKGDFDQVIQAIFEEIDYFKHQWIPLENLDRSKLNIRSSVFYEKETCEGTARKWMMYETIGGDFLYEQKYLEQIERQTPDHIRKIALKYLKPNRLAAVLVHPDHSKIKLKLPRIKNKKLIVKKKYKELEEISGIRKFQLSNGITILTKENNRLPLISLYQIALGGTRYETSRNNGISQLLTSMLSKGTQTKPAPRIAEISESIAGHVEGHAGRNSWGLSAGFLSEKFEAGLDLFCDVLLNPSFDQEELQKEKKWLLEAIKTQEDSPSQLAFQKFQGLLYKKHPYGMPLLGHKKAIQPIRQAELRQFYRKLFNPRQMIIAAVGDFKTESLVEFLSEALPAIKPGRYPSPQCKPEKPPRTIQKIEYKKQKMQAHIVLGFLGTTVQNKDRYAFEVLNNILAGQGGRLFLELRDKGALAYTVTSMLVEGMEPGFFAVYIGTEPRKVDEAISGILRELKAVRETPVTEQELNRSKNYIIGNHEIDLQRNSTIAAYLAFNEMYGLGREEYENFSKKIEAVSIDEVLAVAKKYLTLNAYTLSVVKP